MKRLATFVLLLVFGATAAYAAPMSDKDKINALLNSLDQPGITFIRNGETHDGAWAKQHLSDKLAKAGDKVKTPSDFIAQVGSSSSATGKPYQIKTADGKTVNSADYFKAQLAKLK